MLKPRYILLLGGLLFAGLLFCGCKDDTPTATTLPVVAADAVPDFSLPDVNPTSATTGQVVSPRDHLQQVSAWYFGHAT